MWLGFLMLSIIGVCLETAVLPHLEIYHQRPDLILLLVVFFALHARGANGLIVAWAAGLLVDLSSQSPLGLFAITYGLVGLGVFQIREMVFRDQLLTHVVVTLLACLFVQFTFAFYFEFAFPAAAELKPVFRQALVTTAYTVLLVPVLQYPLLRLGKWLDLRPPRESQRHRFAL